MANKGKEIKQFFKVPIWLIVILAVVLILRIPSFFEPFSYGDELIYLVLGEGIRQKVTLYSNLHDNKPPLLYVLAAIAGSVFWFKVILAFWSFITIILFWNLSKILFPKKKGLHKISTAVFAALTTLPLLEGNIANAELFMIGPTILAFIILLKGRVTYKKIFFSGILFSIATLFKVPAAFDVPIIVFLWLLGIKKIKDFQKLILNTLVLFAGFILPILLTIVYYYFRGAFQEYMIAAFLQNIGYVSTWRPDDSQLGFFEKNKPLIIRGVFVAISFFVLYIKRRKLSKQFIFTAGWLILALFAAALSERPYPHYLVQAVPAFSLLIGILVFEKTMMQVYAIFPITIAFFVPFYYHYWHYPTLIYYQKFIKFASNQMPKDTYFKTFGGKTLINYDLAEFVAKNTNRSDKVFVWEDGVAIYAISRRLPPIKYVADYHIKDFYSKEKVVEKLSENPPELIVVLPEASDFDELKFLLEDKYMFYANIENASIWKLIY